ncbi:MAG TPA: protein kinase [Pirellulales bacterium]
MGSESAKSAAPSPSANPRIRAARERFEASWRSGKPTPIEALLADARPGEVKELLAELLRVEFAQFRQTGAPLDQAEYQRRFPEDAALVSEIFNAPPDSDAPTTRILHSQIGDPNAESADGSPVIAAAAEYVNLEFHAQGGLGEVFSARDRALHRRVALKFIRTEHVHRADVRERFLFEAEVTGRLDHPGVAPVYSVGEAPDGRPFYAMRFIRGKKLSTSIAAYHAADGTKTERHQERLALCALVRHLASAANTLAYAHHRGVAHLDVKPDNIMIGSYGETLIVDWGLATPLDDAKRYALSMVEQQTRIIDRGSGPSGSIGGTLPFMSPEQLDKSWGEVGPASDIYALGVTLYNILTGRMPFTGGDVELDYREPKRAGRFPLPSKSGRCVPEALEAICIHAMSPRPENRYEKATDFAEDLERWLADEPVSVYEEGWGERLVRGTRRHRNWTISVAAATLLVTAIGLISAVVLARANDRERTDRLAAQEASDLAKEMQHKAEVARQSSLRLAAQFAARIVASQIDLRLRIVEAKADEASLAKLLKDANGQPRDSEPRKKLQAWLEECKKSTDGSTRSDSWFILNDKGVQLARAEFDDKTIDESFWFRDYYNGKGLDLPTTPKRDDVRPLRRPYVSNLYQSKATGRIRVAFVSPIWGSPVDKPEGRDPIGVLAMSIDVGEFKSLQIGLEEEQTATLASLRPDVVEGSEARGMILHHPRLVATLTKQLATAEGVKNLPRLDSELVDRLEKLRERRLAQLQLGDGTPALDGSLDPAYKDLLSDEPNAKYLAVFEPVFVPTWQNDPEVYDPGWVVIVQEREGK